VTPWAVAEVKRLSECGLESAIATVNGRTRADDAGVIAVIALFS
jgi:hypothetical protein